MCCNAECIKYALYTECHYAKYRYAECRGAQIKVLALMLVGLSLIVTHTKLWLNRKKDRHQVFVTNFMKMAQNGLNNP